MKEWDHWSASQIETFRMCNRKWWWNYIFGVPKEDTVDTVLGKQVHAEIEYYLTTGDASKLGEIARPALAAGHLPKPGTVEIEVPIGVDKRAEVATGEALITLAGMPGEGYIDVLDLRCGHAAVWDHKTTGDLKYAKTVEELRSNVQMILYAEAGRRLHRQRFGSEVSGIRVGHIVYLKRFPFGTRKTPCDLSIRDITEGLAAAEETVKQMKSLSTEKNPDRVPPTWSACSAYRGCQHRERCDALRRVSGQASTAFAGISGANIETPLSEKKMNPLLDKLKKGAGGAAPAKPETKTVAAPAKEAAAPAAGDPKSALLAKLKGGGGAVTQEKPKGPNPPDASDGKAAAANPITQKLQARAADASAEKTARKPRNYEERLGALNWTGAQIGKMSAETMHKILDGSIDQAGGSYSILNDGTLYKIPPREETEEIPDLNSNEAVEMGAALGWEESDIDAFADEVFERILKEKIEKSSVEDVVMGGRGNKKIVDLKIKPPPPPPAAAKKTAPAPVVATPQETGDTLALFIDCRPVKGFSDSAIELSEYLVPLQQKVAEVEKVEHYSLAPYSRGPQMVAALVAQAPPKGVFVVDTRLPCTMAVLEVLRVHADIIVQGRW